MKNIQMEIKPDINQIDLADTWIENTLKNMEMTCVKGFGLSCHELVVNSVEAMIHKNIYNKNISMKFDFDNGKVEFTVNDWGGGVPLDRIENISWESYDVMGERGRGLLLIKSMTDDFSVSLKNDGSCSYTIVKKINN